MLLIFDFCLLLGLTLKEKLPFEIPFVSVVQ